MKKRKLLVLEANIDDMNPQWFEPLMEKLFKEGALDVVLIPSIMKKSRPAVILQVLTEPRRRQKLLQIIFEESTTIGVRSYSVTRFELERRIRTVPTTYGPIRVKEARDGRGKVVTAMPEFESCRELSQRKKVPLKEIYAAGKTFLKPSKSRLR